MREGNKRLIELDLMKVIFNLLCIIGHIVIQQLETQITVGDAIDYLLAQACISDCTHIFTF